MSLQSFKLSIPFLKYSQYTKWWSDKTLIFIALSLLLLSDKSAFLYFQLNLFKPFSVFLGILLVATFVGLLNDFTDIESDRISGKKNFISELLPWKRNFLVIASFILVIIFPFYFNISSLAQVPYFGGLLSYLLYSIPPIRLKERALLGAFADACGSVVFPSMYLILAIFPDHLFPEYAQLVIAVMAWTFIYGTRAIFIHQYADKESDVISKTPTVMTKMTDYDIKVLEKPLLCAELLSFTLIILQFKLLVIITTILSFAFYCFLQWIYFKYINMHISIIRIRPVMSLIFLHGYYLLYWPLSLIVILDFTFYAKIFLVTIILLFFPKFFLQEYKSLRLVFLKFTGRC